MGKLFYKIMSGGPANMVWDVESAVWVSDSTPVVDPNDPLMSDRVLTLDDLDSLIRTLRYYNYPLGELTPPEELVAEYNNAITSRLNAFAATRQYDSIDRAMIMALNEDFKADGDRASHVYSIVWAAAIPLSDQVFAKTISVSDALNQLPAMTWE